MKKLLIFLIGLIVVVSCDKPYVYDGPDGVNSHLFELKTKADTTYVLVYSTNSWTVRFVEEPSWAELLDTDETRAPGADGFRFAWKQNTSIARETKVVVYFPAKRDTITMRQKGAEVTFSTETQNFNVPQQAGSLEIPLTTNLLPEHISAIKVEEDYTPGIEKWVSDITVSVTGISLNYNRLILPEERSVRLTFSYIDVFGEKIINYPLIITQK